MSHSATCCHKLLQDAIDAIICHYAYIPVVLQLITSCRSLLHPIAVCDILCTSKRVSQDTIRRVSQDTIIGVNYIMMRQDATRCDRM